MNRALAAEPVRGQEAAEAPWMNVHVLAFETRRDLGRAYVARDRGADPLPHLINADRRLMRLDEYARRHAAEAAGITYIHPAQLSLFDGCMPGDGQAG